MVLTITPLSGIALLIRSIQKNLVTLLQCRTLAEADLIVTLLEGSSVRAIIPDEFLMQSLGWNLAAYGYVRVQVAPTDYEAAVAVL